MAQPFSRLILELKKQIATVHGECAEDWGAENSRARPAIRTAIKINFPGLSEDDRRALDDLNKPPRLSDRSISISHTRNLGGWITVPRPAQVGWDVELKARIQLRVIERVCTRDEIEKAPHPVYLWGAKEAYFKALEDDQPLVISQLTIGHWQPLSTDMWSWEGLGPRNGKGLLLDSGTWIFAACLIP